MNLDMKLKFNFNKRNLGLSKKLWKKYIKASYKYKTDTDKMTTSDYTHLFGYLNPYYRSAYNVSKRKK